jgi:hypothetical protein
MQQIVIAAVASVLLISTVAFPKYALASSYDGQDVLRTSFNDVNPELTDLDVEEAVEAENTTMPGTANQSTTNATGVQFLAIQRAQSGSISEIKATTYTLSLTNMSNDTILFSDRPERIVETVSTADFVGNWNTGPNSFAADAPNDALIMEDTQAGNLETAVSHLIQSTI